MTAPGNILQFLPIRAPSRIVTLEPICLWLRMVRLLRYSQSLRRDERMLTVVSFICFLDLFILDNLCHEFGLSDNALADKSISFHIGASPTHFGHQ